MQKYKTHLAVNHVRDHHDLINLLVGELERALGHLDIECHDDRFGSLDAVRQSLKREDAEQGADSVPQADADV